MNLHSRDQEINGIINILKPPGMTSHDVVGYVRRKLGKVKAGHSGTLDPGAVGVLPIFIGKATRLIEFHDDSHKKYRAELALGIESDSYDMYGALSYHRIDRQIDQDEILDILESFKGTILQTPPRHSAIKINGKRAYDLARKGQDFVIKSREINISAINLIHFPDDINLMQDKRLVFDVECSRGTYIRSICHDIGTRLKSHAVMSFLIRTASGPFKIENGVFLQDVSEENLNEILLPMDFGLSAMLRIDFDEGQEEMLLHGRSVCIIENPIERKCISDSLPQAGDKFLAYSAKNGELLAVCTFIAQEGLIYAKPGKVFQ